MTIASRELFELCKQVYEATGWKGLGRRYINEPLEKDDWIPIYTSDYLLEKLPKSLNRYGLFELAPTRAETMWSAGYWTNDRLETFSVIGDTPLKALLKLTLNLHEEGIL